MAGHEAHRILIVDDERLISDTLFRIFTNAGYETRAVYSAEDALKVVNAKNWIPQFALIDVHLSGMNGIDPGVLLRSACPDCRIILISGQPSTADLLEKATDEGHHFDLVAKPMHPAELLELASLSLQSGSAAFVPSAFAQ